MEKNYPVKTIHTLAVHSFMIALLVLPLRAVSSPLANTYDPEYPIIEESPGEIRINAGGVFVNSSDSGSDWQANDISGPVAGANYSVNTGVPFTTSGILFENRDASMPSYIDEATFNAIFSAERYDPPAEPEMEFNIPVANGDYLVNIFLADGFVTTDTEGARVFDILVEGVLAKDNLDLVAEFGHQVAGMLQFPVSITDNAINIQFIHEIENPLVNAIEIVAMGNSSDPGDTSGLRINSGGNEVVGSDGEGNWQANSTAGAEAGMGYSVNTGEVFSSSNVLFANRDASIPDYIDEITFNALFNSERFDLPSAPEMEYSVPLVNGIYEVNIYAANSFDQTSDIGQRIFGIQIEGNTVEAELDLVARFGHQVGGMLSYEVELTDGLLNITFLHGVAENPLVNAIEIRAKETTEAPIVIEAIPDQLSYEGDVLSGDFAILASGGEGALAYTASNLPPGLNIDQNTGEITGTIEEGTAVSSPYFVNVTVDDADGTSDDAASLEFTWVVEQRDLVEGFGGFYLIDADTDTPIVRLEEGLEIDYESVKGKRLTVEVIYNGENIRMFLKLQGPTSKRKLERHAPYTLYGDDGAGDYYGRPFRKGPYRMRAWVFPKRFVGDDRPWERYDVRFRLGQRKWYNDDDEEGTTEYEDGAEDQEEDDSLDGSLNQDSDTPESSADRLSQSVVVIQKNPVSSHVEFRVDQAKIDVIHVAIYDTKGRLVRVAARKDLGLINTTYTVDTAGLRDGLYFMNITSASYETITKRILIRNLRSY